MIFLWLLACTGSGGDTAPHLDTGWYHDPSDTGACADQVVEVSPAEGADDWYWRTWPRVEVSTDLHEAYSVRLLDEHGVEVPTELVWRGERFDVTFDGGLAPLTGHVLEVTDCDGTHRTAFRTSAFGQPLEVVPGSLSGDTWVFDMTTATWIEPAGFSAILSLYFNDPILIGVQWADPGLIDLIGALGRTRDLGDVVQDTTLPSWDFPAADFTDAPYFEARAEKVTFSYQDIVVDVYDFELSATFSSDGTRMGGARVSGLGDTRNMGDLVGKKGDPKAMCDLANTWSVPCVPCPDGNSYCMQLTAVDADGELVDGLSIRQIAE